VAEFSQLGAIVTLHRLSCDRASAIENRLERLARTRAIALVLPCLFDEMSRPALQDIVGNLASVRYLDRVVVSLGKAPADGVQIAQRYFAPLPQDVSIVWNDGPRMQSLYERLEYEGLSADCDGKGRAVWIACGYLLAQGHKDVIAVHDCDITTYRSDLLTRLCMPLAHPELDFQFAKGYYARLAANEMYGRVTRLFVAPLLRALQSVVGESPILQYLAAFHYPLAGEFAMTADLARRMSMRADWALEIGMLTDVYHQCPSEAICQTELCTRYDHKHQTLGDDGFETGLLKMCVDIARSLLTTLDDEGMHLPNGRWRDLVAAYRKAADDLVGRYRAEAAVNGLRYALSKETALVESFATALATACERHAARAMAPLLPSWERVSAALPQFGEWLKDVVELDSSVMADVAYGIG
jgi:glucosyl-3-phosphoglycerate synthase